MAYAFLEGLVSKHHKPKTLIERLKGYYRIAEHEASESVPFYVTGDGVMFSDPKEVIRAKVVKRQFSAFESLRSELKKAPASDQKEAAAGESI
ncbi:hypothetical protein D9M69_412090 [compost metagenome]